MNDIVSIKCTKCGNRQEVPTVPTKMNDPVKCLKCGTMARFNDWVNLGADETEKEAATIEENQTPLHRFKSNVVYVTVDEKTAKIIGWGVVWAFFEFFVYLLVIGVIGFVLVMLIGSIRCR